MKRYTKIYMDHFGFKIPEDVSCELCGSPAAAPTKILKMQTIYPVITLYQPWATWIMRGWKTIETRTHDRFKVLNNRWILIHAGRWGSVIHTWT